MDTHCFCPRLGIPHELCGKTSSNRYIAGDGAGGITGAALLFTRSFNSLLGLKNGIFFAGTSTRSPVFGFRPTRGLRWRVRKLPNPRISILSPTRSERTTLSKIVSTITSLSLRVSSASRETSSIRSAFVISLFAPFGAGSLYGLRVPEGIAAPVPALRLPITFSNLRGSVQVGKRAPEKGFSVLGSHFPAKDG